MYCSAIDNEVTAAVGATRQISLKTGRFCPQDPSGSGRRISSSRVPVAEIGMGE
jgi:hypothetical protein